MQQGSGWCIRDDTTHKELLPDVIVPPPCEELSWFYHALVNLVFGVCIDHSLVYDNVK